MFIDEIVLSLKAGKWGDGIVSWRREKYIPKWGPFGGDGGDGGDIILRATTNENTFTKFRHKKEIKAENGERWGTQEMHGANAEDLILDVPVGTIVTDTEDGTALHDFTRDGEEFLICEWGRGGFGNAHFPSSTRQAPNFAELGDIGEEKTVKLELKLVADVGLVGLPNAGKSTLIQSLTNVRPKIANYAFTTLTPNLGVMEWKGRSLVIEDVPGLIEWASEGKGLGFQFLKHIDRCRIIIHLLDASMGEEAITENYLTIRKELENWSESMAEKEELIIFSKSDIIDEEHIEEMKNYFEKKTGKTVSLMLSAGAYMNVDTLKDILIEKIPEQLEIVSENEETTKTAPIRIYDLKKRSDPKQFKLERLENGDFRISGDRIEEIARMTDTRYTDGVGRIYDILGKLGIIRKIKHLLVQDMEQWMHGFFEGEEDLAMPDIVIGEKKFSLDGIIFMKE